MATWSLAGRHAGPDKPPTPVLCSRQSPPQCAFLFSEEFTGDAAAFFQACADHQLEGIVSKLPRQNTEADAARPGSSASASWRARSSLSAQTETAKQAH